MAVDVIHAAIPDRDRREGSMALNLPGTGTQFLDPNIVEQSLVGISGQIDDKFDRSDQHVIVDNTGLNVAIVSQPIGVTGSLSTSVIPSTYSKRTQNSDQFVIAKGNLNKLRIRPQIQNEHAESSREIMATVNSSTVVGQVFKASQSNINGLALTLQSAAAFASMDAITAGGGENKAGTMEYASDGALQAEYIKTGAVEAVRSAFTDLALNTQDGSWAMKISMHTVSVEWVATLSSTDLTNVTFSLRFAQDQTYSQAKAVFFIGDGTNTKSYPLSVGAKDVWQTFAFTETAMTDDGATPPTMTAITKMGFRIDDRANNKSAYIDSITYQAEPGSVDLELWDMGAALPTGNGTVNYATVGTQYTELGDRGIAGFVQSGVNLPLVGGKRKYHIDSFIAGTAPEIPANTTLTPNNYYAFVLKYVDTDVSVHGPNTTIGTDYYTNGYAWSAATGDGLIDRAAGINGGGIYSDLMFQIFSTQDIYVTQNQLFADSAPGDDADVSIFVEDDGMIITDIIASVQRGGMGRTELSHDLSDTPVFMANGGKFEAYYNDDPTDDVTKMLFSMDYCFVPPTVNG